MSASQQAAANRIKPARAAIATILLAVALSSALAADQPDPAPPTEAIQVLLGQSKLLEMPWAVKRVAVADPDIVNVQVLTPKQILLQATKAGETDLIIWNADERVQTRRVEVDIDVARIRQELQTLFPDTALEVAKFRNMVTLKGTLSQAQQAVQLHEFLNNQEIQYIDMTSVGGIQQVLLQVRIAEVSRQAIRSLGVNFFDGGEDFFGGVSVGSIGGGALNPVSVGPAEAVNIANNLPFTFNSDVAINPSITLWGGLPDKNFQFFIQALAENQYLRILAEPTLVALSGEEANFLAGGEFPIPIAQDVSGGGSSITIEYREFGVQLRFKPIVLGDGTIQLFVAPEVSELSDVGAVEISGFQVPALTTRRAETTLQLKSQQTFAMAGLLRRTSAARSSRIPGIGDVPVLGPLFSSKRHTAGETELVVLVTASLVEPLNDTPSWPGIDHVDPNDWEFYLLGRIEGQVPAVPPVSPEDRQVLQDKGLHRLKGPGAWARYNQPAVRSRAVTSPEELTSAMGFSHGAGVDDDVPR